MNVGKIAQGHFWKYSTPFTEDLSSSMSTYVSLTSPVLLKHVANRDINVSSDPIHIAMNNCITS